MNLPEDVKEVLKIKFTQEFHLANNILKEHLELNNYLESERIIRCVVFLSEASIESLKSNLNLAKQDPRDVMYLAEYEGDFEGHNVKRVRDFNGSFTVNGILKN